VARKKRKQPETGAAGFDEKTASASEKRERMTPVDIQQKVFRLAFRGYNERDVDEFLDGITEDLAALHEENKRLREQVAEGGGGVDAGAADRQAEAIVRQAREHAARLVEDAEQRAEAIGSGGVPSGTGLPASFLLQERQFLQQMASLIQGHARRLKEEARRARAAEAEPEAPGRAPSGDEGEPSSGAAPGVGGAAAAVGGAAIGAAGVASGEDSSELLEEPPSAAPSPEEATSPWAPVEPEGQEEEGEEESRPPAEGSTGGDPLVSAWESAFTADPSEAALADESPPREDPEGEPSLRELFWGEE
jgi:cell division initiation protein